MPGFKFNEPHFCWTVIISIPWSQTQMNYRNPACDSPTPWDGKRHLEGNLGWIWREFFGRNAARLLRSSFQEQDTNCRSWKLWEVVFWILASHQSLRGFLSSTVRALENTLRMLKLWNFPAVWGHYWEEKLVTDFWRCMLCSLHGLLHLQHILHPPPGNSWAILLWFQEFPFQESQLWMATPPCLFGNSPLSFLASSKQNYPWKTRFNSCPTTQGCLQHLQHHTQMHQIHHWLSPVEKTFPCLFFLLFPAPGQGLPAHIFPPALGWSLAGCSVTLQRSDK